MLHFKQILVIFLLVMTGMSAHAQQKEQRIALVIGNSAYRNTAPLKNPVNDATDMAQVLREKGFQVTVRNNLEVKEMRQVIRNFSQALKAGGVGLFYFAGHGIQSKGRNYLIPTNADVKEEYELEDEAIDANRVLDGMEAAGNRVNIVILDACRDNPYARSWRGGSRGLAQLSAPIGSFVAFATAPGSVAADGSGRNGVFTQHLLTSLRHPDTDIDKVFTRVTAAVSKESGNKQVPWKSSSLTGEFLFSQQQPTVQASVSSIQLTESQREDKFWDAALATGNKEAFESYIESYPKGRYAGLARANMARLSTSTQVGRPTTPAQSQYVATQAVVSIFKDCPDCPEMVMLPAGSFEMGGGNPNEMPMHRVTIKSFAMGKTEVTQGQWKAVMGSNPSHFNNCGDNCPIESVSWEYAKQFVSRLSAKTGKTYRLPSEAEWEYACRAGRRQEYCGSDSADNVGWYSANSGNETRSVAGRQANAWGLHDMSGNVWEWTDDCWNENYGGAPTDGNAWTTGNCSRRVARGGSWFSFPQDLRSAYRGWFTSTIWGGSLGFRVARDN